MIQDCLEVFEQVYNEYGGTLFDDIRLPNGVYYLVHLDGTLTELRVANNKDSIPSDILYRKIANYYIRSVYVSSNKAIDKKFKSTNYLSMLMKCKYFTDAYYAKNKEKIITDLEKHYDYYYTNLIGANIKGNKKRLAAIYPPLTVEQIYPYKEKVKEIATQFARENWNKYKDNDILGIFFEAPQAIWEQEIQRYLATASVLSVNDVAFRDGQAYSVPDFQYTGYRDKPFLWGGTLDFLPIALNSKELILWHYFRVYIESLYLKGKCYFYIDIEEKQIHAFTAKEEVKFKREHPSTNKFNGYFFIMASNETTKYIEKFQYVSQFSTVIDGFKIPMLFKHIKKAEEIHTDEERVHVIEQEGLVKKQGHAPNFEFPMTIKSVGQMLLVLDTTLFNRKLIGNLYKNYSDITSADLATAPYLGELNGAILDWLYLGKIDTNIRRAFKQYLIPLLIKNATLGLSDYKMQNMLTVINALDNFFSLQLGGTLQTIGGSSVGETCVEKLESTLALVREQYMANQEFSLSIQTDEDFALYAGQILTYLIQLSETSNLSQLKHIICQFNSTIRVKQYLQLCLKRYAHNIHSKLSTYMISLLLNYQCKSNKLNMEIYLIGIYYPNIFFQKLNKPMENTSNKGENVNES